MKNVDDLLDEVKKRTEWKSDYAIGKGLGYSYTAQVNSWKRRASFPSNKDLIKMCEKANIDLGDAVRAVEFSREFERPLKLAQAGMTNVTYLSMLASSSAAVLSLSAVTSPETALISCGLAGSLGAALYIIRSNELK